jgi:hypothetical protein
MPVPNAITDLSTTPAVNSPAGSEAPTEGDNHLRTVYAFIRELYNDKASVNFSQLETGAVVRTALAKMREIFTPEDFGAVGDGATDDTVAIQAAFTTGKCIRFPDPTKTYRITGTLNLRTDLQVIDFNFATIELDDATGLLSHVSIGDNVVQLNGVKVYNWLFTRTQAATAGAGFNCRYVGDLIIGNGRCFGNSRIHRGVIVNRGIRVRVADNHIQDTVSNGVYAVGTGAGANRTVDLLLFNNRIESTGAEGLSCFDYTEGVFCRDNIFYDCEGASVSVSATNTTTGLYSFKFEGNDFDTATGAGLGVYLQNVDNISVSDNWFSNNTGVNVQIESGVDSYIVSGNQIYGDTAKSIQAAGDNGVICGNLLSGGEDGIFVRSTVNTCVVSGNIIRGMSGYGINRLEGPTNLVVGADNAYSTNALGNVSA